MQKPSIAFFDFDGTITRKDTMFEFVRFVFGKKRLYGGMLQISPWLAALKAGIYPAHKAKEKLLSHFFKGMKLQTFDQHAKRFSETILPGLLRPHAMREIATHRKKGHKVVVVSASAENWVKDFCDDHQLFCIATRLEVDTEGCLTGKISGANCNAAEKVNRIKCEFDPADFENIYAYGDSNGDKEMLALATHPHYRLFKD